MNRRRSNVLNPRPILANFAADDAVAFWELVEPCDGDFCWPWLGKHDIDGYGSFTLRGRVYRSSRVAWVLHNNEEIGKLYACHSCDNSGCVNPHHIWAGTLGQNGLDRVAKGYGGVMRMEWHEQRRKMLEKVPLSQRSVVALELYQQQKRERLEALQARQKGKR